MGRSCVDWKKHMDVAFEMKKMQFWSIQVPKMPKARDKCHREEYRESRKKYFIIELKKEGFCLKYEALISKCWNISELPTSPHQLKLLAWTDPCMQLNTKVYLLSEGHQQTFQGNQQNLCHWTGHHQCLHKLTAPSLQLLFETPVNKNQTCINQIITWFGSHIQKIIIAGIPLHMSRYQNEIRSQYAQACGCNLAWFQFYTHQA